MKNKKKSAVILRFKIRIGKYQIIIQNNNVFRNKARKLKEFNSGEYNEILMNYYCRAFEDLPCRGWWAARAAAGKGGAGWSLSSFSATRAES